MSWLQLRTGGHRCNSLHSGGSETVARLLIEKGADVFAATKDGNSSLYFASQWGKEAFTRLLIEKGADVLAATEAGRTPLHFAARSGSEVIARLLIEKRADISAAEGGQAALNFATVRGYHLLV